MQVNMIVATTKDRVIGKNNALIRHLPEDLQHFKKITLGAPIVMGLNTYKSIGRPLPGRRNIVISFTPVEIEGVEVFTNPDEAINALREQNVEKAWIIGGASIYAYFIDKVDNLHLTLVKQDYEGDTFFPEYQHLFTEVSREEHPTHDFIVYSKNHG